MLTFVCRFGTMVGSVLNSSVPAHLLPLADCGGDLDGALLTDETSQLFRGGFTPTGDGLVRLNRSSLPGIGVESK